MNPSFPSPLILNLTAVKSHVVSSRTKTKCQFREERTLIYSIHLQSFYYDYSLPNGEVFFINRGFPKSYHHYITPYIVQAIWRYVTPRTKTVWWVIGFLSDERWKSARPSSPALLIITEWKHVIAIALDSLILAALTTHLTFLRSQNRTPSDILCTVPSGQLPRPYYNFS